MAGTRKARVPMAEQIRLINECRQSGMTDADWCRENDIAVSTFYNWVSRCRKAAADQIPAANYGHLEVPRPKQDVVPIDIVPDHIPEQHTASQRLNSHLDNSHTIEVAMKDITVRISNDADPILSIPDDSEPSFRKRATPDWRLCRTVIFIHCFQDTANHFPSFFY